jgi:hypothetical protein
LLLLLPLHLLGRHILRPTLALLFEVEQTPFLDFSITYPEKLISHIQKPSAVLIHGLDIFHESKFDVQRR